MLRANRNTDRDRKNNAPKVYKSNGGRSSQDYRNPENARGRDTSNDRRSEIEWRRMDNDLYERQSI
ncbi:MAG TPA: hypothetical protein VFZ78_01785 [Flavisolibacter sp.]